MSDETGETRRCAQQVDDGGGWGRTTRCQRKAAPSSEYCRQHAPAAKAKRETLNRARGRLTYATDGVRLVAGRVGLLLAQHVADDAPENVKQAARLILDAEAERVAAAAALATLSTPTGPTR